MAEKVLLRSLTEIDGTELPPLVPVGVVAVVVVLLHAAMRSTAAPAASAGSPFIARLEINVAPPPY
jgi:hypothetical protein